VRFCRSGGADGYWKTCWYGIGGALGSGTERVEGDGKGRGGGAWKESVRLVKLGEADSG